MSARQLALGALELPVHEAVSLAVVCILVLIGLLTWIFQPEDFQPDLRTDEELQESIAARQAQPAEPPVIVNKRPQPTNWIETLLRRGA